MSSRRRRTIVRRRSDSVVVLGDDVLHIIFKFLNCEQLVKCGAVCRQWRDVLQAEYHWKKLFLRSKLEALLPLRQPNQTLRNFCQKMLALKNNWLDGFYTQYMRQAEHDSAFNLSISGDYVAWDFYRMERDTDHGFEHCRGCAFLNIETETTQEIESVYMFQAVDTEDEYVRVGIHEPWRSWEIDIRTEDDENQHAYRPTSSRGKLLFCYSTSTDQERLRVWQMDRPQELDSKMEEKPTLIHDRSRESLHLNIEGADANFIMTAGHSGRAGFSTLYFTSHFTDALIDVRALTVFNCQAYRYDRGLLFQNRGLGIVSILDVASGVHFNDVRLPLERESDRSLVSMLRVWAASNENVIVIGWQYVSLKTQRLKSILSVYSREEVETVHLQQQQQQQRQPIYPLYNLRLAKDMDIADLEMDETRLAVIGVKRGGRKYGMRIVFVLNFAVASGKGDDIKIIQV
jgi:hypothetical protein